ncbi:MAG: lysophospholipid acyltransferase family protein [Steroidobacteraceae bacterium]
MTLPKPLRIVYTGYFALVFLVLGLLGLALMALPGLELRRNIARVLGRIILWLAGMRVRLRGVENLPYPCVIVANHASYLDGVVMAAALPPHFAFVIKNEMAGVPLAGLLLTRIGAQFVERRDRARGAMDARRILRRASDGDALVFFPEGTFSSQRGLLRFHIGAFAIATRAKLPIVPVAIRGTRRRLPPDSALAMPGRINIAILPPVKVPPQTTDPAAALRDAARAALLAELDEPDLSDE